MRLGSLQLGILEHDAFCMFHPNNHIKGPLEMERQGLNLGYFKGRTIGYPGSVY